MDVALLDQYSTALTRIARVGGLVAIGQLPQFFELHRSQTFRISQILERARMCAIERTTPMVGFVLLSKSVARALGSSMPVPPQRGKLHPQRIRNAVGRAAYFLKFDRTPQSLGDLSKRWSSTTSKTQGRIEGLVMRQIAEWRAQALQLKKQYNATPLPDLRRDYEVIRRKLRTPETITKAGMTALKIIRGVYLLIDEKELAARFVFIERGASARRLETIAEMAIRFGRATNIEVFLDIACGSMHSKARVERLFEQIRLGLHINILDLGFERFLTRDSVSFGPLLTKEIAPILEAVAHE